MLWPTRDWGRGGLRHKFPIRTTYAIPCNWFRSKKLCTCPFRKSYPDAPRSARGCSRWLGANSSAATRRRRAVRHEATNRGYTDALDDVVLAFGFRNAEPTERGMELPARLATIRNGDGPFSLGAVTNADSSTADIMADILLIGAQDRGNNNRAKR